MRRCALSLVGLIALVGTAGVPMRVEASDSSAGSVLVRPAFLAPQHPSGATRAGVVDPTRVIEFDVVLAPSHPQELATLLRELYDPKSPHYERWLAPGAFSRRFAPSASAIAAVVGWLDSNGLAHAQPADGRVEVHATAGAVTKALKISLAKFRLADGTESFRMDRAPLVPAAIAPDIASIVGLSDTSTMRPHVELGARVGSISRIAPHASSCATAVQQQANRQGGLTTRQVAAKYQVSGLWNAGLTGTGTTVALFELAPHTASDVAAYFTCFGLHNGVTTKAVDGGASARNRGDIVEANLDIEDAAVTAPGAKIVSYEGPNTERAAIDIWSAIVNDDKAQVISTSWGKCEPLQSASERNALHQLFAQAAAQGQTIFAAAGDSGSEDCLNQNGSTALAVDSPANDPLVTAVGGTSLHANISLTNPDHESVWNDCINTAGRSCANAGGGAGGGALSHVYAKPSWQPIAAESSCATRCREVPDLSANAGVGEAFETGGQWQLIGGTSIAAPKLAGIAADVATGCVDSLGAFNGKLYAFAKTGVYGTALRDIPSGQGNNDLTVSNSGLYRTAAGFDLATGLGTPIATGLACPQITHLNPTTAAAGTRVKIIGIALARATIRFGTKTAQVVSRSTTSATVIVPKGAAHVQVGASDAIGYGTHQAAFAYR